MQLRGMIGLVLLGGLLGGLVGCASVGTSELSSEIQGVPKAKRERVYPLFVNSPNDPLRMTHFVDVADYVRKAGFANTKYFGVWSGGGPLAAEIRKIKQRDPGARIALIGWSGASLWCWDAAEEVARDGITVDEIIYLDSQWLIDRLAKNPRHPTNVGRIVLLYRIGHEPPRGLPRSEAYVIPTHEHLAIATEPATLEYMVREFVRLAGRVGAGR